MRLARPSTRLIIYALDSLMILIISSCFIPIFYNFIQYYSILISLCAFPIIYFIYSYVYMRISKGYTLFSYLFRVKYVKEREEPINKSQAFLISFHQMIIIFAVIDILYLVLFRVERGLIEKISNTFCLSL